MIGIHEIHESLDYSVGQKRVSLKTFELNRENDSKLSTTLNSSFTERQTYEER